MKTRRSGEVSVPEQELREYPIIMGFFAIIGANVGEIVA